MFIEDGTGTGQKAAVNSENQLIVQSVTRPYLSRVNLDSGKVWSIPLDAVAPSGATWFLCFFNGGTTTYAVAQMMLVSSVSGVFRASKVTGTPAGGTNIVPTSLNLGKTVLLDNVVVQKGASITGLSENALISPLQIPQYQPVVLAADPMIIIPPGTTGLGIQAPAAATVNGFITLAEIGV